jgi:hypothetical protein
MTKKKLNTYTLEFKESAIPVAYCGLKIITSLRSVSLIFSG